MDFGKVDEPGRIRFALPVDDPRSAATLAEARQTRTREGGRDFSVHLGAPAWGCKDWIGTLYPKGAKPTELLGLYAQCFNAIELNTTHYRIPDEATVRRWRDATPETFRFCPKIPQEISHRLLLRGAGRPTEAFFAAVGGLGERLGCTFLQLPPHFSPIDLPVLAAWLKAIPRGYAVSVEFRHPAFFANGRLSAPAFDTLANAGAGAVVTDVAGRRDVLHSSLPSPDLFLRLILNDLHPSDFARSADWSTRIAAWREAGLRTAYLFVHQPDDKATPEFAAAWTAELNTALGTDLRSPLAASLDNSKVSEAGRQLGFFDS